LAVCLPVLVLLVFASIESCSMIFLRQALSATTYEGVRVAIRAEATNQNVLDRCQEVLDGRNVRGASVTTTPADITAVDEGDPITVTVTASCDANSIMPPWFFGGRSLTASSAMVKE
jgi:Flp pilus assembly protein TadG